MPIMPGRQGLTLTELMIAMGLSSLAFASLISLTGLAGRNQAQGMNSLSAEMASTLAFKALSIELSQATLLVSPSMPSLTSGVLEACANASDPASPSPIDLGRPMRFFAFCLSGGILYHHSLPGCPAVYTCGSDYSAAYGTSRVPLGASFLRPAPYKMIIEASLTASSGQALVSRGSSFTIAAAAGRNQ